MLLQSLYLLFFLHLSLVSSTEETCASGKIYNECGSACTATCSAPNPICTRQCISKCECPHTKPIFENGKCIHISECPKNKECVGGRVYNDCASKCVRTCDRRNLPCIKMCDSRCACPPEKPIWHNQRCIEEKYCPPDPIEVIKLQKLQKKEEKEKRSFWDSLVSFVYPPAAITADCTTGPHGKMCENGGIENGKLGNCVCVCPKLTAGDNCEIVIALGRPYGKTVSKRKTCLSNDVTCIGGWKSDLLPDGLFAEKDRFDVASAIEEYTIQGIAEHTSIASFSRVTLQLLQLGAPSSIVNLLLLAAQDEIKHAKICFAIVDQLSKTPDSNERKSDYPDIFPLPNASIPTDIYTLTSETLKEGIVGESVAAVRLCIRSRTTSNVDLKNILRDVAQDEAKHAALAWKTLSYIIQKKSHKMNAKSAIKHWLNSTSFTGIKTHPQVLKEKVTYISSGYFGLLNTEQVKIIQEIVVEGFIRPTLEKILVINSLSKLHKYNVEGIIGDCVEMVINEYHQLD